jgi:hypothetical protein
VATRFAPLRFPDPDVFGVRAHGAFGRGDRERLLDLGRRCLDHDKVRLVIECSELDSLGGSGAGVLADLQRQLVARGGELVFVAAGPVIERFLARKFADLPLRCFGTVADAAAALGTEAAPETRRHAGTAPDAASNDLDSLLDGYDTGDAPVSKTDRLTADLVTAAYVSLDDVLCAASESGNPTVLGESLSILLDAHDLAAGTLLCLRDGDRFVATDRTLRVPVDGGIATALRRVGRPLTMLDIEDGELWDEETQLLEEQRPDLIVPYVRGGVLQGIVFLQRAGDDHEYGLAEVFAVEMLQRLLAGADDHRHDPATPESGDADARMVTLPGGASADVLLGVKLELVRGLHEAQDVPHFWQVFISRLRLAAEVTSLLFVDSGDAGTPPFLSGEARRQDDGVDLSGERLATFFRTLERPVEVANMPASFAAVRDALLARGLAWLVSLRVEDQVLGVVALGLDWRCAAAEPADALHEVVEITSEAFLRLREGQRRANMSLGLLESLIVGDDGDQPDLVTRETVGSVRLLARELGLPPDQERDLVLGALVRNVGQERTDIHDLDSDRLTGEEWEQFRDHPDAGDRRMAQLDAPAAVRNAVRHHHERFDGRGFPLGLAGRDIPLVARMVAVAQHHALVVVEGGASAAEGAVREQAGLSLDPDLVEIFLKALGREATVVPTPETVDA